MDVGQELLQANTVCIYYDNQIDISLALGELVYLPIETRFG